MADYDSSKCTKHDKSYTYYECNICKAQYSDHKDAESCYDSHYPFYNNSKVAHDIVYRAYSMFPTTVQFDFKTTEVVKTTVKPSKDEEEIELTSTTEKKCTVEYTISKLLPPEVLSVKSSLVVAKGSGDGVKTKGQEVTITANSPESTKEEFRVWSGLDGVEFAIKSESDKEVVYYSAKDSTTKFKMPGKSLYVTATYATKPSYNLVVNGGSGGGLKMFDTNVTVKASIPQGKTFKKWNGGENITTFVEGDLSSSTVKFKMPREDVNLTAEFKDA